MFRLVGSLALGISLLVFQGTAGDGPKHITFDEFLKQYSTTIFPEERDSLLENFWQYARQKGIPFVEENKTDVIFLYRGMDSVRIVGDFTSWAFRMPMRHLPESDLWYLKLSFEPDARLDYQFFLAGKSAILDPQNRHTAPSDRGGHSELSMPDFSAAPELDEQKQTGKGTLSTLILGSKSLGYDHRVIVYLPFGYDTSKASYPVAYFQDGENYLSFAKTATILDNLNASDPANQMIGVFVVPPLEANHNRVTEYGLNKSYEKFITTELVPAIDKKYRTIRLPSGRLLTGVSHGGLMSLSIALANQDLFANAASQSGFITFKNDTILSLFKNSQLKTLRVYLGVGTYEKNVAGSIPMKPEGDLLAANRRLSKLLDQLGYQARYREFHDGHSWGRWRTELPNILRWAFPRKDSN